MSDPVQDDETLAIDTDLIEYLLVSVRSLDHAEEVARTMSGLVAEGVVRLIDVVLLDRAAGRTSVREQAPADVQALAELGRIMDGRLRLSAHDIALAGGTIGQDGAALLLLVEHRWASGLATAARASGGLLVAGERIGRERVLLGLARTAVGERPDLLGRSPATDRRAENAVDPVAQLHALADLVDRGLLTLEQYEAQRRVVLDG
ncbi:hypothetical protein [Nocardioides insulae]|uniref:hypothetical protein n=1 Tax=Nocardioides insulae TaxID=394734 RepID=UPI000491BBDF|nr:hypothetical protein [Nocardioides insulae]